MSHPRADQTQYISSSSDESEDSDDGFVLVAPAAESQQQRRQRPRLDAGQVEHRPPHSWTHESEPPRALQQELQGVAAAPPASSATCELLSSSSSSFSSAPAAADGALAAEQDEWARQMRARSLGAQQSDNEEEKYAQHSYGPADEEQEQSHDEEEEERFGAPCVPDDYDRSALGCYLPRSALGRPASSLLSTRDALSGHPPQSKVFPRVLIKNHHTFNTQPHKRSKKHYRHPVKPKGTQQMERLQARRMRSGAFQDQLGEQEELQEQDKPAKQEQQREETAPDV